MAFKKFKFTCRTIFVKLFVFHQLNQNVCTSFYFEFYYFFLDNSHASFSSKINTSLVKL